MATVGPNIIYIYTIHKVTESSPWKLRRKTPGPVSHSEIFPCVTPKLEHPRDSKPCGDNEE